MQIHIGSRVLIALLTLTAAATAQTPINSGRQRITAPIRDAGTLHLGTGQWTHGQAPATLAPDVIFANTCSPTYFLSIDQFSRVVDEGRLPSCATRRQPSGTIVGGYDATPGMGLDFSIDSFRISYCTDQTRFQCTIGFQGVYPPCSPSAPDQLFALTGLPATLTAGTVACWLVNIDLAAANLAFTAPADGATNASSHLFGWSFQLDSPASLNTGVVIAGDFGLCTGTDGTRWDVAPFSPPPIWPNNVGEPGTGMGTLDQFRTEHTPPIFYDGCHWFGGSPLGSFFFELRATAAMPAGTCGVGTDFCAPSASGVIACPCGNPARGSARGCENSSGSGGARIVASGSSSLANDSIVFSSSGETPSATSIVLQGDALLGSGSVFGQGVLCAGGSLKRLFVHTAASGVVSAPSGADLPVSQRSSALGDPIAPGHWRYYQVYYRDLTVLGACPATSTFNSTQALALHWTL